MVDVISVVQILQLPAHPTSAVEAVRRQFRKLIKTKSDFAIENSLLKRLYSGMPKASRHAGRILYNIEACRCRS
ncbi:transposase ISSBa9 protein [Idiomarina xiamenensis 10-D-4]|uniref:Transposase ISSBa9 protein n=1 Tax=Idiomarina xiamenensis 10-D-4 TaxID=740709 RepID=K2LCN3_9GAMM|nr:transposase ISSBa9 protein [Idiomarina xiamenensis 10-D-4]